jgi:GT2 family glycosyltransferase
VSRTVVVIPTHHERESIQRRGGQLVAAMPRDVAVVNDESSGGITTVGAETAARSPRVHRVNHRPKAGIGPAANVGFQQDLALGVDHVVQTDADLSPLPEMLPRFVERREDADVSAPW